MEKEILNFSKRFADDEWFAGNCYYYSVILKSRFGGKIYYDCIAGHFVVEIDGKFYDYGGEYTPVDTNAVIRWSKFIQYDKLQKKRIIRDCIR